MRAKLTIVDGMGAGETHDILTRDQSLSGISFLLRQSLRVGQQCRIEFENQPGRRHAAEIVRTRPISGGRFEMALELRKKTTAPTNHKSVGES
ncbi:MAG: PilZ domain-containing protein [Tepidisphaeraceae bacterium]